MVRVIRFVKVTKLLRLLKLGRIVKRYKIKLNLSPIFTKITQCSLILILSWHYIACAFWGISREEGFCDWTDDSLLNTSEYYTFGATADYPNGFTTCLSDWVAWKGLVDQTLSTQYAQSFFWAVMITTGVGRDLAPGTNLEVFFTIIIILYGILIDAVIIGTITAAIASIDAVDESRKKVENLNEHLRINKISLRLRFEISDYFDFFFSSQCSENDKFQELPTPLRMKLDIAMKKNMVIGCPFFNELNDMSILMTLIQGLEPLVTMPREYLTKEDTMSQKMFIIVDGDFTLYQRVRNTYEKWKILTSGLLEHHGVDRSVLIQNLFKSASRVSQLHREKQDTSEQVQVEKCKVHPSYRNYFGEDSAFLNVTDRMSARSVHYSQVMVLDTSSQKFKNDRHDFPDSDCKEREDSGLLKENPLADVAIKNPALIRAVQVHANKRYREWYSKMKESANQKKMQTTKNKLQLNSNSYQAVVTDDDESDSSSLDSCESDDESALVSMNETFLYDEGDYHHKRAEMHEASWHA